MDRANWPEAMKGQSVELGVEKVLAFIQRAELAARKQFFWRVAASSWLAPI